MTSAEMRSQIEESVLTLLDTGLEPWAKPWKPSQSGFGVAHANLKTRRPYRGINPLILTCQAIVKAYPLPLWLGFKQAKGFGGHVAKGEKATYIYKPHAKKVKDETTGTDKWIVSGFGVARVFNVAQCQGLEGKLPIIEKPEDRQAEDIVSGFPPVAPSVRESPDTDRACYYPGLDSIDIPLRTQFETLESFYATLFHELAHATGAKGRLARDMAGEFGSEEYAKEELVAELSGAMLSGLCGFEGYERAHASYLQNWKDKIAAEPRLLITALGKAEKAVDYILGEPIGLTI
jgi:antirestriction protein ArdC